MSIQGGETRVSAGDWRFIAGRGRLESRRKSSFISEGSRLYRCDVLAKMDMSVLVERNQETLARPLFFSWITLRLSFQDQSSSFSAGR